MIPREFLLGGLPQESCAPAEGVHKRELRRAPGGRAGGRGRPPRRRRAGLPRARARGGMEGPPTGPPGPPGAPVRAPGRRLGARLAGWASSSAGLLDLRPSPEFALRALRGSTSVPAAQLPGRWLELPPRERPFALLVPCGAPLALPTKAGSAHKWDLTDVFESSQALWEEAEALGLLYVPGPADSGVPLWRPCPLLAEHLPEIERRAAFAGGNRRKNLECLDVGCGAGRDTVFLASRGHHVRALDVRRPQLERLAAFAERNACARNVTCEEVDLRDPASAAAALQAPFHLAVVVRFLHRPLLAQLAAGLEPGGCLVYEHFLSGSEAVGGPSRPEDRLEPGELSGLFKRDGWDLLVADDTGSLPDGRPVSRLVAFKPTI